MCVMDPDTLARTLAADTDATTAERALVLAVHAVPGSTLRELATVCGLSREWTTRALARARDRGYVRRNRAPFERGHRYWPA